MPLHHLTSAWTTVARAGDNASVINSGQGLVELGGPGASRASKLPPGASYNVVALRGDLHTRSLGPKAEVVTTVSLGVLPDL